MNPDPAAKKARVLVVDDEANIRKTLKICLESRGYEVALADGVDAALSEAGQRVYDLAFVDLRLGNDSGLELIPRLVEICPWMRIVVITAYATVDSAVDAMKKGASDYLAKPFTPEQVIHAAERAVSIREMQNRIEELQKNLESLHPPLLFHSSNPGMQRVLELARQVADSQACIMLRGPSGTGKTALARVIHNWSGRRDKPFVVISCPSLSAELLESELFGHVKGAFTGALRDNPGKISACEGGTLFLDEIADLPKAIQAKLLRFVQDREYERLGDNRLQRSDVRIITATNARLEDAILQGQFREDLWYRLNVVQVEMPALRERPEDIEALSRGMLEYFSAQNHKSIHAFSPDALDFLKSHAWPGNLRELRNVIERAVLLCKGDVIDLLHLAGTHLTQESAARIGGDATLDELEELHIRGILARCDSMQEAAEMLGIDQTTLWRKRKKYGI